MEEKTNEDKEWVCECGTHNHKDFTYCVSCEKLKESYALDISEKGILINMVVISDEIFQEEKHEYTAIEREDQIDHLIDWIGECGQDRQSDKELMKEDLKYLIGLEDDYLFSSISTNDFIAKSDDEENFNRICKELLELNK